MPVKMILHFDKDEDEYKSVCSNLKTLRNGFGIAMKKSDDPERKAQMDADALEVSSHLVNYMKAMKKLKNAIASYHGVPMSEEIDTARDKEIALRVKESRNAMTQVETIMKKSDLKVVRITNKGDVNVLDLDEK